MRGLALLAPLLLSGCALLFPSLPRPPEGIEHDGYILACEGVAIDECKAEADLVAGSFPDPGRPGSEIRWIIVRPDGHELCWEGPRGAGCHGERLGGPMTPQATEGSGSVEG